MTDEQQQQAAMVRREAFGATGGVLIPENLAQAMDLARMLADTDFVPNDFKGKPGNVLAAVQMGAELGLAPMQALQGIAVINGRPSVWGDAALALCRVHPEWGGISEETDGDTATCRVYRVEHTLAGVERRETARSFSMADAKKAGLLAKKGPWQDYPGRMLQMRARSWAIRDAFTDALKGLSLVEEQRDVVSVQSDPLPAATATPQPAKAAGVNRLREKLQRDATPPKAKALPPAAVEWVEALNRSTIVDDVMAIERDFAEVVGDMPQDVADAVQAAITAAADRVGKL